MRRIDAYIDAIVLQWRRAAEKYGPHEKCNSEQFCNDHLAKLVAMGVIYANSANEAVKVGLKQRGSVTSIRKRIVSSWEMSNGIRNEYLS